MDLASLGQLSLQLALVTGLYAFIALVLGMRRRQQNLVRSGHNALIGTAIAATVATFSLVRLLVAPDFSIEYVAHNVSLEMSGVYRFAALWAGQEGSLLLWLWVLSLLAVAIQALTPEEARPLLPGASAVIAVVAIFFAGLLVWMTPPFVRLPTPPADGLGMNPLLETLGMLIHPPGTYLGYVGFTVPFAFAISALLARRTDDVWLRVTRLYTLGAWVSLSIGMMYGAQWAYEELGWGGYWAWDPVENASLLPWLTSTAFFHSAMIQERRGMMKGWNIGLITATFLLTILGTFLTRSGILASVHAFSEGALGPLFLGFIALAGAATGLIIYLRRDVIREPHRLESAISKESSFLGNNLLLVGMAFTVLWGTFFPLLSEAVRGTKVTVGPPWYNRVIAPLGLALVVEMGLCPLLAWRRASVRNIRRNFLVPVAVAVLLVAVAFVAGVRNPAALGALGATSFTATTLVLEFIKGTRARRHLSGDPWPLALWNVVNRNRRRYGGYLVHLAVILMVAGITVSNLYSKSTEVALDRGGTATVGGYTIAYEGLYERYIGRKVEVFADLAVTRTSDGALVARLRPAKRFSFNSDQPTSEVAIQGSLREDLYAILGGWDQTGRASFKFLVNPMVQPIWYGMWLLVAGTLFAMLPVRRRAVREAMDVRLIGDLPQQPGLWRGAGAGTSLIGRPGTGESLGTGAAGDSLTTRARPGNSLTSWLLAIAVAGATALSALLGTALLGTAPAEAASPEAVRSVEAQLMCQCGCTMVVNTCECDWAEQARADIAAKLDAGQDPPAILASYVSLYGEKVLAAPTRRGFNLAAWVTPFAAVGAGGLLVLALTHRWAAAGELARQSGWTGGYLGIGSQADSPADADPRATAGSPAGAAQASAGVVSKAGDPEVQQAEEHLRELIRRHY